MKKLSLKYKLPLLIFINIIPFVLDAVFYTSGAVDNLYLFPLVFTCLTVLNYMSFDKTVHFVLFQAYILVCLICSGYISTYLYYHNISSDPMTPAIGMLTVLLGAGTDIIITIIAAIVRATKNRSACK